MQWKKHWVTGTVVECSLVWTGASWRQQAVSIHRVKSKHPWRVTCESYATIRSKLFQVVLCQASLREISLAAGKVIAPPHTYTASYIPEALLAPSSMKSPFSSSSCAFLNHVRTWPLGLQCHWVMISSVNHKKDKEDWKW